MDLTKLVQRVNSLLAGEELLYNELEVHLDAVIDDINNRLNSTYPAFSEFNNTDHTQYPDYDFFPDKFIRSVVSIGAAHKFYVTDEEGIATAAKYEEDYNKNLFYMERDYLELVPEEYQNTDYEGLLTQDEAYDRGIWVDNGFLE